MREGGRRKAEGGRREAEGSRLPSGERRRQLRLLSRGLNRRGVVSRPACLLPTAFRLLPSAFCLLFLSGCRGSQSALDPAGPQAARIINLWWLMFYVTGAVFLVVMCFLAASLFRSRRTSSGVEAGDGPDTRPDPG